MRKRSVWRHYNDKGEKRCAICRRYLPRGKFHPSKESADRLHSQCRECTIQRAAQWAASNGHYGSHRYNAKNIGSAPLPRAIFNQLVQQPCTFGGGSRADGIHIGVDRRDAALLYTVENCQPCCPRHNSMRGQIDDADFRSHLNKHPEHRICGNRSDFNKWGDPETMTELPGLPICPDPLWMPLFDGVEDDDDLRRAEERIGVITDDILQLAQRAMSHPDDVDLIDLIHKKLDECELALDDWRKTA